MEIQGAINKKLEVASFDEQLAEFRERIVDGDKVGLAKIDNLVELEKRKQGNPSYVEGYNNWEAKNAPIVAGHLKDFLRIMAKHEVKPDSSFTYVAKIQKTGFFSKRKYTVKQQKNVPAWQINYDSSDGYPKYFHLTQDGRISANTYGVGSGWIPSEYKGMGMLLDSLAGKMLKAGITETK